MTHPLTALVIGGTGPTGHFIVSGLHQRGYRVAILHTGNHEIDETPDDVEHIHVNPFDEQALTDSLQGRHFDLCVATYGRLRVIARLMQGKCGRFISVGGQPCYLGYMHPARLFPQGMPVPSPESSALVAESADDEKGYRIVRTEQALFELQPDATHFRYPFIYGKYQAAPREWCIVKRIIDRREHIILPDGGLTLLSMGYAENMAHALLLAIDNESVSRGEIYNCADSQTFSLRQAVDVIADELDHQWRIVNMPWEIARPTQPLIMQPLSTHRLVDISKLQRDLNYTDLVSPQQALARTARMFVEEPPADEAMLRWILQDPFDYQTEDELIRHWDTALASMPAQQYSEELGYGLAYSGPGGRERSSKEFTN